MTLVSLAGRAFASRLRLWALLSLLSMSACSSGTTLQTSDFAAVPTAHGGQLAVRLVIGAVAAPQSEARRRPRFISPATLGVRIVLSGASTYSQTFDLSPGSAPCGGATGSPRTCAGSLSGVALGTYTVSANTYDMVPAGGVIPAGAHLLATGSVTGVNVQAGTANVTSLIVGGVVTGYGSSAYISVPGDGSIHAVGFALAPQDAAGETIVAGASLNDPYANPMSVTLTESGGSGHETLVKNGVAVGTTTLVSRSTDSIQVNYDGGGAPGYSGSVTISANGVATATVSVSPLYVRAAHFASANTIAFLNGQVSALTLSEANAPNSVTYSATAHNCAGIATASVPVGSGGNATANVTAGSTKSAGSCSITIADNVGSSTSVVYGVINTSYSFTTYPLAIGSLISDVSAGTDGLLWAVDTANRTIDKITLTGSATALSRPSFFFTPQYVTAGPDGNMWVTDADVTTTKIDCITTSGSVCGQYPVLAGGKPAGIIAGPDGNLWFATSGPNRIERITTVGSVTQFTPPLLGTANATGGPQLAVGGDGNVWFTELGNTLGRITPGGAITEISSGITPGARTYGLTAAPDSSLWFTEFSGSRIGHVTFDLAGTPTIVEIAAVCLDFPLTTISQPWNIAVGGDGNIWFVQSSGIGRMSPGGSFNIVTSTTTGNIGMTRAADGTVWFGDGQTGVFPLGGSGAPLVSKIND